MSDCDPQTAPFRHLAQARERHAVVALEAHTSLGSMSTVASISSTGNSPPC